MKKITLFRSLQNKQSLNYKTALDYFSQLSYDHSEATLDDSIDNHNINFFFLSENELLSYLEEKRHYFKFGFSNFLILGFEPTDFKLIETYNFKQIYINLPSITQFKIDVLQANQASLENVKQHIKVYFTGYLLESIIHELNNPLTSVTLNCQLILEMVESKMTFKEGQLEQLLNHTLNSLTKSSLITKNVLRYATYNAEDKEFFNLTDVLKNVFLFTAPMFRKKQLKLEFPENDDFLVYSNISDVNLLVVIIFYLMVKSSEKNATVHIEFNGNQCAFSSDIEIQKIEDLYKGLFIPAFYVDLTLEEILHRNKIQPIVSNNTLYLTLPQTDE